MTKDFEIVIKGIINLIEDWETRLLDLSDDIVAGKRNIQNRTIKQILGHLVDSASNNIHRIVHLHYQDSPFYFPNYATYGNNDRWIDIQNYQQANWKNLVQLWKYCHLHLVYVIKNIQEDKLENEWIASPENKITLKAMVIDYLRHINLHLNEIEELINKTK